MRLWQGAWVWYMDGYHLQKYFSQVSCKWANKLKEVKVPELRSGGADVQTRVCLIASIISPTILDVHEIFALPCHLSLCGQPLGAGRSFIISLQYLTHLALWGAIPCSFLVSLLSRAICCSSHVTHDAGRARVTCFSGSSFPGTGL